LKLSEGGCVQSCPRGFMANYESTKCVMAGGDVTVVYFPWLIMSLIALGLSLAGGKSKIKHLVVPNWLVMMGIIENLSMFTQIVMTFKFGTWRYTIPIVAAYAIYVIANIVFAVLFHLKVAMADPAYARWQSQPENRFTKRVVYFCGFVLSWKSFKLLYSHFWGYNIKSVFKNPTGFRQLQRQFLIVNCCSTYLIVLLLNLYGLYDMDKGNQLYICFMENGALVLLMTGVGWWEQRKQTTTYLTDT